MLWDLDGLVPAFLGEDGSDGGVSQRAVGAVAGLDQVDASLVIAFA